MRLSFACLLALLLVPSLAAVELGQIDDFQNGLQGWRTGGSNPNGPEAVMNLGPDGIGDRAMQLTSGGGGGAGSRLVVFNQSQWTGNYVTAGVTGVRFDLKNLSEVDLMIRLAVRGVGGSFATEATSLPAGAVYRTVTLSLLPEDLTAVGGFDVDATLQGVFELRILHSQAPAVSGDAISASIAVDNVTAVRVFECADALKADSPSDVLFLPAFEVDTASNAGLTTFFSVHNRLDETVVARVSYFDRASNLVREDDITFASRRTLTLNVRDVLPDLVVDDDGFARGWVQVRACVPETPLSSAKALANNNQLWGDWFYLDNAGNFASGDQLLRRADLCETLEVRLLDFGSGVRLRLFVTNPQGAESQTPTATLTVYNEAGQMLETQQIFTDDSVLTLTLGDLVMTRFGMMTIDFTAGTGAASVEYSAFGRFSVAMNATCIEALASSSERMTLETTGRTHEALGPPGRR